MAYSSVLLLAAGSGVVIPEMNSAYILSARYLIKYVLHLYYCT